MESKWFIIIAMLASFLYKLYKKNKEKQEESFEQNSTENPSSSWGMEDLISEFQNKYGVETEPNFEGQNELEQEESEWGSYEVQNEEVIEQEPVVEYSSENADHHAFETDIEKQNIEAYEKEDDVFDIEYDLRQMIISNTILTRPEY